jgi:hypothetical protein
MTTPNPPQELPAAMELPPELFNAAKAVAPHAALAALEEGDVGSEIEGIVAAGPAVVAGVLGYCIGNFADSIVRGFGGRVAAVDEITRELARATIRPDQIEAAGDVR